MKKIKASGNARWIGRTVRVDRAQDMRRYDRLPRDVRDALKDTAGDQACVGLSGILKKGIPPAVLAAHLMKEDHASHNALMFAEFGCVP